MMTLASIFDADIVSTLSNACAANVIVPEYPGYGDYHKKARGVGDEADRAMYAHVHSVIDELRQKGIRDISIVARSIGTGIALGALTSQQGSSHAVSNVALISPFTSVCDLAPYGTQWLVPRRLDNLKHIQELPKHIRTLVVHGTEDTFVPFCQGRKLSDARNDCSFVPIRGMAHAIDASQFAQISRAVGAFIKSSRIQSDNATNITFDIFKPE
tara:strand:- start:5563 stop:6204 length:642 start_codon:yes stop_codon:yes gene_type:complete